MEDKILQMLINLDHYVRENLVTHEEARVTEDRIMTHMDGFIKLHETLDVEIVALRSKVDRLEGRIEKVEQKLSLA
jgi:hypothetical protein